MGISQEKIKDALDSFENDSFMDAKDALGGEIRATRDKFLKDKLGLKDWGNPPEEKDSEEE